MLHRHVVCLAILQLARRRGGQRGAWDSASVREASSDRLARRRGSASAPASVAYAANEDPLIDIRSLARNFADATPRRAPSTRPLMQGSRCVVAGPPLSF